MLFDKILEWLVPIGTLASSGFAGWAAFAASKAATATAIQADASRTQLISEQRAWISFDFFIRSGIEFHENGADIAVSVINRNIGKTPALEVHTQISPIVYSSGPNEEFVTSKFQKMANACRKEEPNYGKLLLPGSSYEREWSITFPNDELCKYKYLPLFIMVCVTYKILHDKELHQTAILYGLILPLNETFDRVKLQNANITIPINNIGASEWPGGFAD